MNTELNTEIMSAKTSNSLTRPDEGTEEYFEKYKLVVKSKIENALLNEEYECYIDDFDLWMGFDKQELEIFKYLEDLGYNFEKKECDGLGIKISWGYL